MSAPDSASTAIPLRQHGPVLLLLALPGLLYCLAPAVEHRFRSRPLVIAVALICTIS
ncbi:hypothetical protein [Nocardia tengchongensis]